MTEPDPEYAYELAASRPEPDHGMSPWRAQQLAVSTPCPVCGVGTGEPCLPTCGWAPA